MPIETLPDGPLLESFSFYVEGIYEACDLVEVSGIKLLEAWCTLVHVCQRWRNLVFASPRAACLHKRNIREGNFEHLVFLAPIVVKARFQGFYSPTGMGRTGRTLLASY